MPAFDVTIHDKTYRVEIPDPGATPLLVIVDGQPFQVGIAGTEVAATAARLAAPPPPAPQPPPLPPPPRLATHRPAAPPLARSSDVIAPMPGTILSVEVNVGQRVEVGQVLCVLEAMKMKNPIRATHPGTVAEVYVHPGRTVPHGEVLIRLA